MTTNAMDPGAMSRGARIRHHDEQMLGIARYHDRWRAHPVMWVQMWRLLTERRHQRDLEIVEALYDLLTARQNQRGSD